MLLSKKAMKKANMKLDLANDKAEIYGQVVHLQITSTGHYCVPLKETSVQIKNCSTTVEADEDIVKVITKLHKQFAPLLQIVCYVMLVFLIKHAVKLLMSLHQPVPYVTNSRKHLLTSY